MGYGMKRVLGCRATYKGGILRNRWSNKARDQPFLFNGHLEEGFNRDFYLPIDHAFDQGER